jgi:hypothetical protein
VILFEQIDDGRDLQGFIKAPWYVHTDLSARVGFRRAI